MAAVILKSNAFPAGQVTILPENLPLTIGRSNESDLVINDKLLSRKHAQLKVNLAGNVEIVDLDSMNLTIVNGQDIDTQVLKTGDLLLLGDTEIQIEVRMTPLSDGAANEEMDGGTTADLTIVPLDRDTVEND